MKLLTTHKEFLEDVGKIRSQLNMPAAGFKNKEDKTKWALEWDKQLPNGSEYLKDHRSLFFNAEQLITKYQLRYNFRPHIELFILFNRVDAPKINCDVSSGPDTKGLRANKWISIKAYAPLTKVEIHAATKKLLELQKVYFPKKVTLDLRPHIDIDLALRIEKEMELRRREIIEKPSFYLEQVRKKYGEGEYRKAIKLNPEKMEKEYIHYTSKEVAKKFFRSYKKDALVRKIYSRIKEKRKQLFC